MRKLTLEQFIVQAKSIHNDKYDYSKSIYVNGSTKIEIWCVQHHTPFYPTPHNHISRKSGCPICYSENKSFSAEIFIQKAKEIHGNVFDYKMVSYKNTYTKVEIICSKHGSFWQTPHGHIYRKSICPNCYFDSKRLSLDEFIIRANAVHNNKYDYSSSIFEETRKKIQIICPKHGLFSQIANDHLKGSGCPDCSSNISKLETKWLDSLNIPNECRNTILFINNKSYNVDAFISDKNTVYEFYGDYWHGNPVVFSPNQRNKNNKRTFKDLYRATIRREQEILKAGYKVISIWENDWKIMQIDFTDATS